MANSKRKLREKAEKAEKAKRRPSPLQGTAVVWAKGVEARYGISAWTRWNWECNGKLPPRDVAIGGRTGWRPETLAAAERAP